MRAHTRWPIAEREVEFPCLMRDFKSQIIQRISFMRSHVLSCVGSVMTVRVPSSSWATLLLLMSYVFPLSAISAPLAPGPEPLSAHISYGPDVRVDADSRGAYVEPAIAADPSAANTLVAAAESGNVTSPPQVLVSHDGGYQWTLAPLLMTSGSSLIGDVQLAADPNGHIYFASLGRKGGMEGIHVFVSTDHDNRFREMAFLRPPRGGFDHEQLTVDQSHGPYRGRIYMSALYTLHMSPQLNACGLVYSSDAGRHFHGPVEVVDGWCFNSRPVTLSDGTLIFPFFISGKLGDRVAKVEVAISKDGGKAFGAPRMIGRYFSLGLARLKRWIAKGKTDFDGDPVPQFTTGRSPKTGREVIYGVWSDTRTGNSRLLFTRSTDEGLRWSRPVPILTTDNANDAQYQVSLAVNPRGILGVAYLQYSSSSGRVREMFADSTDGGVSFSTPDPIQRTPAKLGLLKAWGYVPENFGRLVNSRFRGRIAVGFTRPGERFPSGGDYVGMAVDRHGTFHPIWADARTGTDQIWTAAVSVGVSQSTPSRLISADVTKDMDVVFGPSTWDAATKTLSTTTRLHNVGKVPLYPPFKVTVLALHNPDWPAKLQSQKRPIIVNADNGVRGPGALYVYDSQTLGDLGDLEPGAETASRIWKIAVRGSNPVIILRIDGREEK